MGSTGIILAAGRGTRMGGGVPKVLLEVASVPMLEHVIISIIGYVNNIIVVASQELVKNSKFKIIEGRYRFITVIQEEPSGTMDALRCAFDQCIEIHSKILIALGDAPLIEQNIISELVNSDSDLFISAFESNRENEYGKLIIDNGKLIEIVEHKQSTQLQRKITICNSGLLSCSKVLALRFLQENYSKKEPKNEQYLTDIVKYLHLNQATIKFDKFEEKYLCGANTRQELVVIEEFMQEKLRNNLIENGVVMIAPKTVFLTPFTFVEPGVIIYPYTVLGKEVYIKSGVKILSFSHIEGAKIEKNCIVGPFARIRPDTELRENAKIGNFVEVKNSIIGDNSKCSHLSYIGDAYIGEGVNIGAGSVFCNYDGAKKHKSNVGDNTFIGSNTSIVSPLTIERDSFIAAGTVLTKNMPEGSFAISRPELIVKKRRHKKAF
ncbi:Bifunctional protein GlmU [Candidatus Cyrtobacter comes]|uniref:Bifunctional protein GlmU n=1 Tax=Candidatus Cyrtobacter comes TaxID=675776 RepID=A0ABU5L8R6_9RICK|nr:bifunctional UDP-N-acetylglucosamine diphosphorylase/glucosamine-1-phosphate N-acetyltransferase GlmU [Candidatus Cyrtobacter comes]MDZ5762516.1 Bifunctional protein GlmU [Candidatus Cyrtobacter comes]